MKKLLISILAVIVASFILSVGCSKFKDNTGPDGTGDCDLVLTCEECHGSRENLEATLDSVEEGLRTENRGDG